MARPAGLEPATYALEVRCSIQLSYGRVTGWVLARSFRTGKLLIKGKFYSQISLITADQIFEKIESSRKAFTDTTLRGFFLDLLKDLEKRESEDQGVAPFVSFVSNVDPGILPVCFSGPYLSPIFPGVILLCL